MESFSSKYPNSHNILSRVLEAAAVSSELDTKDKRKIDLLDYILYDDREVVKDLFKRENHD